jgi:hypothetical protein
MGDRLDSSTSHMLVWSTAYLGELEQTKRERGSKRCLSSQPISTGLSLAELTNVLRLIDVHTFRSITC